MRVKKVAFTLAEVLITLGIIGIVAAMTMPALIQNYKKQEYSAKLKKFYSTMSQAITRSEVDNGSALLWSKANQVKNEEGGVDFSANADLNRVFLKKYILPYLKYTSEGVMDYPEPPYIEQHEVVRLADGSEFMVYNGTCMDIVYDINGIGKSPNMSGKDRFRFLMCFDDNQRNTYFKNNKQFFGTYFYCNTREQALSACKSLGHNCSTLLKMDGWEFKDDYPYKL